MNPMTPLARVLALVLLGGLALAGGARPAAAAAPERSESVLQGSQVLAHCPGFDVLDQYDATVVTTRFVDQAGTTVELRLSIQGTDTYVRSDTGRAIVQPTRFTARIDQQALVNISAGLVYRLVVPGLGNVLLDAGRTVYDFATGSFVFLAGPHQVTTGDTAGLCAAFA
jgi:hypothetical protein